MKKGLYLHLAADGIRKNKRMYLPYIFTCIGMVAMYYIIEFLTYSDVIASLHGGRNICGMMMFGGWVMAVFSLIFLFYTNSFLIKRRKKEFGLYNMLGMGKRHIGIILFWETLIILIISLAAGLFCGIVLSKLAELCIVKMMDGAAVFSVSIAPTGIIYAVAVFSVIFFLIFLNGIRQIGFSGAINLLRSESAGEKPPKGNAVIGIIGAAVLVLAYFIALNATNPIDAITLFFVAVILVIISTYAVMISTSVFFCRLLKKNKKYYYKANHFVSTSSMAYRMKRNGAGLASICILATMVMVMISSTSCLYFGAEDALISRYPREINIHYACNSLDAFTDEAIDARKNTIFAALDEANVTATDISEIRYAEISGVIEGNKVRFETDYTADDGVFSKVKNFYVISDADYSYLSGTETVLDDGKAIIMYEKTDYTEPLFSFCGGREYEVERAEKGTFKILSGQVGSSVECYIIVVHELEEAGLPFLPKSEDATGGMYSSVLYYNYCFNTNLDSDGQIELTNNLAEKLFDFSTKTDDGDAVHLTYFYIEGREINRGSFYGTNGGILCLAILLSIVFITAAVLIIYYKQVSEGYEDQARFEIMQKVGMTKKEIRKSINSQLLTVFFLPLIFAGLHLAFAFPMIKQILFLFSIYNAGLFVLTTVISFVVFTALYLVIYKFTSRAYYKIVSDGN